METRTLSAGEGEALTVSRVGLGCNTFGRRIDFAETSAVLHAALDAGITLLDTAATYGDGLSEEYIGRVLGPRRDEVVIATKFGWGGNAGRKAVLDSAERSLKALRTDRIDLFQIHFPDAATPIAETLSAMDELVRAGKVRFIGCSNFSAAQLEEALAASETSGFARFVTAQNEYNVLRRAIEAELVPACARHGVGILPYRPIASGLLSGKYRRGEAPPPGSRLSDAGPRGAGRLAAADFDLLEALEAFAAAHGRGLVDLALSWLMAQPAVLAVIPGATTPEQVRRNIEACGWAMTAEELAEIDHILGNG